MCVQRESGAQRAVKVLRKSHMDEDEKRMLFNEINILKEIVSALERSQKKLNSSLILDTLFLLTKLCVRIGPSQHHQDVRVLRGREALLPGH